MKTFLFVFALLLSAPTVNTAQLYGEVNADCSMHKNSCILLMHQKSGCQYYAEIDQKNKFSISDMRGGKYLVFITLNGTKYEPFVIDLSPDINFMVFIPKDKKKCEHYFEFR